MELHLDPNQTELLHEVLDAALRNQRHEVAGTDNPEYKRKLKEREQILRSLLEQLAQASPTGTS